MWVNSKTAAAVLSVDLKAIQQGVYRATKQGKNFCSVKLNILCYNSKIIYKKLYPKKLKNG